ncbi:MAG: hypothetical protein ACOH5I_06165 [Oligoflexus sp.]
MSITAIPKVISVLIACLFTIYCFSLVRIDQLAGMPGINNYISSTLYALCLVQLILLALSTKKQAWNFSLFLVFSIVVLTHSYAKIYMPSLDFLTPRLDYLLPGNISSNFSFNIAKTYILNIVLASVILIPLIFDKNVTPQHQNKFFYLLVALYIINIIVVFIQSNDISFLTKGSGTAVSTRRPPGLLEDSGASTVVLSTFFAGFLSYIIFFKKNAYYWIFALLLPFCAYLGSFTKGRVYFVAIILSSFSLFLLMLFLKEKNEKKKWLHKGAIFLMLMTSLIAILWAIPRLYKRRGTTLSLILDDPLKFLQGLDPVRFLHAKTMLAAFTDHPFFGTGLGSFHFVYHMYVDIVFAPGDSKFSDLPTNLYLALPSELGLAGIIIITTSLILFVSATVTSLRNSERTKLDLFIIGATINLVFCFLVGIHIVFKSAALMVSLSILWTIRESWKSNWTRKLLITSGAAVTLLLSTSILVDYFNAPRAPEFYWQERGKPQVPVSVNVPIGAPGPGVWFNSGAEILLQSNPVEFFVELPPEYYPLKAKVYLYDQLGKEREVQEFTVSEYQLPKPGRTLRFHSDLAADIGCLEAITPEHYCSIRIETKPHWRFHEHRMGFFVPQRFLDWPKKG